MRTELLRNYLRMHRRRVGLGQREMAVLLGARHGSKVSRYERGRRLPALQTLIAYEIICGAKWSELLAGEYNRVYSRIRERAQKLAKEVDARTPWTPALQRKFDFLATVIHQSRKPHSS